MALRIKDNVDLKELEKFGYSCYNDGSYWYKYVTSKRRISIWEYDRHIDDDVVDRTTYSGFKYEGEYRHIIKPYIQDLIQAGLVEKVEEV